MAERPKYLQVADTLRTEIADGVFRDGQALMTEEELRIRFGVSRQTVRQAIALLEEDGLVIRRRGSGTYVRHGPRMRHQGIMRVGVLTSSITDYISPAILGGIEAVMNERGVIMYLSATSNDPEKERVILDRMLDGQVDGLIVEGCRASAPTPNLDCYRRLMERNIPMVFMNAYYPEIRNVPHVIMDDSEGGRMAAREILKRGYTRPAGLFKTDDPQGKERARGFLEELKKQGIEPAPENMLYFGTEERMTLFRTQKGDAFMTRAEDPELIDCVACYNDIFAVGFMSELRIRGNRSTRSIGIIGFDDAVVASMASPALTTLAHPQDALGALAAQKLLRMMDGEHQDSVRIPWKLMERESLPTVAKG